MKAGRTTNIASIIPLLGAFVGAAVVMGLLGAGLVMPSVGAAGAVTRTGVDMFDALPSEFTAATLSQQSKILDAKGNVIATPHDENRIIVPLDQIAPVMQKAQVAIEDSRFYEHGGVDVRGVVRALVSNASGSVNTSGGSTLTQQYVKLTLLDTALKNKDTEAAQAATTQKGLAGVTRKLQELKYSIQLEKEQTKDQILQGYLNITYYGDQAYGVEAASKHYFNKGAKDLSLPEAAMIAGLAQNPGTTDPVHYPERAIARRNVVLDRMQELGLITAKESTDAKAVGFDQKNVTSAPTACQAAGNDYAYFCDYVIKWLESDPSLDQALGKTVDERRAKIFGGGLTIQTTIDPDITKAAREEILARVPAGNSYNIGSRRGDPRPEQRGRPGDRPELRLRAQLQDVRPDGRQLGRRHQVRRLRRLPVRVDGEGVRAGHRARAGHADQQHRQRQGGQAPPHPPATPRPSSRGRAAWAPSPGRSATTSPSPRDR